LESGAILEGFASDSGKTAADDDGLEILTTLESAGIDFTWIAFVV
jgi:hypothetical protein